jgi:hypothetical protein
VKKKILIVEDNSVYREILNLFITKMGYGAITAKNSYDAIAFAEAVESRPQTACASTITCNQSLIIPDWPRVAIQRRARLTSTARESTSQPEPNRFLGRPQSILTCRLGAFAGPGVGQSTPSL